MLRKRYLFKNFRISRNSRKFILPQKTRCQEIRILNRTHRPDAATTQQFRFLKQKLMFSYGLRKFSISKIQAPGPRLHDPGAGDQAPWVQDPKTQCLMPRLQANKSRIYCAGLKFNQNYCSAPHIFPQQIHLKTSESCRGCALPRLPMLDSKKKREAHAIAYIAF